MGQEKGAADRKDNIVFYSSKVPQTRERESLFLVEGEEGMTSDGRHDNKLVFGTSVRKRQGLPILWVGLLLKSRVKMRGDNRQGREKGNVESYRRKVEKKSIRSMVEISPGGTERVRLPDTDDLKRN